jgi:hypothetical protein
MENFKQKGLKMADKIMSGSSMGQALKRSMQGLGALQACSPDARMVQGIDDEPMYPEGIKMCLVAGSATLPVVLLQDVFEDMPTAAVRMPDGRNRQVDVEYLIPENECYPDRTGEMEDDSEQ